ncbi:SHOCT domain-containing protein [Patescibacteria group bacterium]|nr:SHOCT domain-containing protein [Patescibacteria group bacterium]
MKKIIFNTISVLGISLLFGGQVLAQGMMGFSSSPPDSASIQGQQQEEQEGKTLLDNLNNKTIACSQVSDSDFEKIGEYFMGQAIGDTSRHIVMNNMMKGMMGKQGEEQAHIVTGKRLSGCDSSAVASSWNDGWTPMMNMMWGGWSSPFGSNNSTNNIMNFGFGPFSGFGWIFMILWWVLIIAGIVALIKWLTSQSRGTHNHEKSALDILKERYAKGEIDKKEFEDKKKDLT